VRLVLVSEDNLSGARLNVTKVLPNFLGVICKLTKEDTGSCYGLHNVLIVAVKKEEFIL
jgi:hypothetical protein